MGGMGLIFTAMLMKCLLGPPGLSRPMTSISWTHIATPNSPIGRYNPLLASHSLQPPTHSPPAQRPPTPDKCNP